MSVNGLVQTRLLRCARPGLGPPIARLRSWAPSNPPYELVVRRPVLSRWCGTPDARPVAELQVARYCRIIKFEFTPEIAENTLKEYNYYSQETNNLRPTQVILGDISFCVVHYLECTMIDGKTCNVLTNEKSSASCNICGARPSQMNELQLVHSLPPKAEFYKLGLSTLHCKIRFMECLLHIAYNMDFKKSSARDEQKSIKDRKKRAFRVL